MAFRIYVECLHAPPTYLPPTFRPSIFTIFYTPKLKTMHITQNLVDMKKHLKSLRSTKWNANLILLRDYVELVALCKVIVWKTHIPVRTQK